MSSSSSTSPAQNAVTRKKSNGSSGGGGNGGGGGIGGFVFSRKKNSDKKRNGSTSNNGSGGGSSGNNADVEEAETAAALKSLKSTLNNSHSCQEISTKKALHLRREDNPNLLVYLRIESIIERMQKEESGKSSNGVWEKMWFFEPDNMGFSAIF